MCRYLTANDLIFDRMNTLYNIWHAMDNDWVSARCEGVGCVE